MISEEVIAGLKKQFPDIHPLIFHRSLERAKTPGELFDILYSMPTEYPIVWNEEGKKWLTTKDLFQAKNCKFNDE
jgi:hypothetical protein